MDPRAAAAQATILRMVDSHRVTTRQPGLPVSQLLMAHMPVLHALITAGVVEVLSVKRPHPLDPTQTRTLEYVRRAA
jgi:hypothetical protein